MDASIGIIEAFKICSSWNDFDSLVAKLPDTKQKGDLFEELVKAFLLLDPEYATKLSHVWLHKEVPDVIRERIKLPAADKGIDLVAQTKDGDFWAIQCKYRADTTHSLSWREISTFSGLAFGVCCCIVSMLFEEKGRSCSYWIPSNSEPLNSAIIE